MVTSISNLSNMEYQLYGGRSLALNSNVPNYMNNYSMPLLNTYGVNNYYNPVMTGYNGTQTSFGQNIPTNYTSAATNIANASNNTQAQVSGSIFKGLNQQETQALKDCYVKGQEPSEGLMGAAFGGVTMGLMNNPRYLAHPINTIMGSHNIKSMFSGIKGTGVLNKLWTDPKTNNVIREAYFQMNKASSRAAGWKFGLFRKRYTEAEYNTLKGIMEKALKSGDVNEIAKASETLKNAYTTNGHIPTLWNKAKAWVKGEKYKPVDILTKTNNADEIAKISNNAKSLVEQSSKTSFTDILKKGGGVKGGMFMAAFELILSWGKIKTAFSKDSETGWKQVGQTTVKAAGNATGWMLGEAAGIWAATATCAKIGTMFGPGVGTLVGGLLGLVGGSIGMWAMSKVTKGLVGEDVASKVEAENLAQTNEGQTQLLQFAAQQAQDGKADIQTQQALLKVLQAQQQAIA